MVSAHLDRYGHHLLLVAIVLAALFLRLYGWNWDQGAYLHPDERFIAMVSASRVSLPFNDLGSLFDPATSPLNPRRDNAQGDPESFAYGTLPIYVQGSASWLLGLVSESDWGSYAELYVVGRVLTAFMDMLTLALVYLLARRLFGQRAALIGAALYAFAVLPVQLAHFFTVDVWLTTFVTATIYLLVRYVDRPTSGRALTIGVPVGMAFASKASVPSLAVVLVAVFAFAFICARQRMAIIEHALAGALVSLAVFTFFEPYALMRLDPYLHDISTQSRIVRGIFDVPFTRQFVGLTPGVYELDNMFRYTLGPAFLVCAVVAVVWATRHAIQRRDAALAIPLLWVVSYVPVLLYTEARFLRYALPLIPVSAVLSGGLMARALLVRRPAFALRGAVAAVLIVTVVWGVGFASIYGRENPRIAASQWMYANIPPDATVSAESWDDPLPLPLNGETNRFETQWLDIYGDAPPDKKVEELWTSLEAVDYVVLSSDRVAGSVDRLPWRYAVQNEFYRRLENGQLGYKLVYEAELLPELFDVRYDDSGADESFWVYDHPRVRIYQRVEQLSLEDFRARFAWSLAQPWEPQRYATRNALMLDFPVAETPVTDDGEWSPLGVRSGLAATVVWILAIELIGLAALPLAARIFSDRETTAALSTRLIGLLLVAWLVWIGAVLQLWSARSWTVVTAVALVAALSWGWRSSRLRDGQSWQLPTMRNYAAAAGVFLGIFGYFIALRTFYPDFWQTYLGGEKPFELAYLRAITASTEYPPYDPWFSDGVINYYYYGWHVIATLIKLTGVGVSHGFQLGSATGAALLGTQAVGLALLLTPAGARRRHSLRVIATAGFALVGVTFAGNFDAVRQIRELGANLDLFDFWGSTRVISSTINEFPYFSALWADLHPHVLSMSMFALLATLMVQLAMTVRAQHALRWSYWQEIAPPLGVAALTLGSVAVTNAWDAPLSVAIVVAGSVYAGMRAGLRATMLMLAAGGAAVAVGFALFAPFFLDFYAVTNGVKVVETPSLLGQWLTFWGIFLVIVTASIAFEFVRALRRGWQPDAWYAATLVLGIAGFVGIFTTWRDGAEVTAFAVAVVWSAGVVAMAAGVAAPSRWPLAWLPALAMLAVLGAALLPSRPAGGLALSIVAATTLLALRHRRSPRRFYPWALVAVAFATIGATELVYVVDDLDGGAWFRMNTVFKFYLPAWILAGVGCGVLLARMWRSMPLSWLTSREPLGAIARPTEVLMSRRTAKPHVLQSIALPVLTGTATAALTLGLVYPVVATPVRLEQDMPTSPDWLTLNGYAWMRDGWILNGTGEAIEYGGDLAAIEWLSENVDEPAVILEGAIGPYRGNGSRISSGTGLPTVIGWARHQEQQRYREDIAPRVTDVHTLYNTTNLELKLDLLRRYQVRYVVVGDVERLWNTPEQPRPYAGAAGLRAFDDLVGHGLELVFESGHTKLYEVTDFPQLPPAPGANHEL